MRAIGADEKNLASFYVIKTLLSAEGAPGAAREPDQTYCNALWRAIPRTQFIALSS